MPIVVRYGQQGGLEIAKQAGEALGTLDQEARGQQLLSTMLADRRARDAQKAQYTLQRLQQQQSQRFAGSATAPRRRTAGPSAVTAPPALREREPGGLPNNMLPRDAAGYGTISGGNTEFAIDAAGQITGRQDDELMTAEQILRRGGTVRDYRPPAPAVSDDPARDAKLQYVQSIAQSVDLPEGELGALQALINDPESDLSDIRVAVNAATTRIRGEQTQQRLEENVRYRRRKDVMGLRQQLRDLGYNPDAGPEQFDEVDRFDLGTGWRDTPADPVARELYNQLQQLEQAVPSEPGGGEDLSQASTDELIRALLQGE